LSENDLHESDARPDRRVARTQAAIRDAFVKLFFERGFDEVGVGDIAEAADVARSTFYQHFTSKEQVLCATMQPMLVHLAAAVDSPEIPPHLPGVIGHFWSNRRLAQAVFTGSAKPAIIRMLADLIEPRLGTPPGAPARLVAMHLAAMQLGLVEEWLTGRYRCPPESLSETLYRSSFASARALTAA
jgi:AcrR family transcriptional regulator